MYLAITFQLIGHLRHIPFVFVFVEVDNMYSVTTLVPVSQVDTFITQR